MGQESEMLNREVQALERQSTLDARCIDEAVQLYDQNSSYHELFQGNFKSFASSFLFMFWCLASKVLYVPLESDSGPVCRRLR